MTFRRPPTPVLALLLGMLIALLFASVAFAEDTSSSTTTEVSAPPVETTTVPAPPAPEAPAASPTSTATTPSPTPTATPETTTVPAPQVRAQRRQPRTVTHAPAGTSAAPQSRETSVPSTSKAFSPSSLTPQLPSTLGASVAGVPSFFIDSFSIPPFLLPIYQAAGAAYGIPWQILAAINEIETDYGRDLNVSSAGAEGWMQFMPSSWGQYGVDVNNDGFQDPYNPADAIFAAAHYLKAAGGNTDIRAAVFAYNHSQAYVNSVLLRARLLGGTPPELLGAITGLTEARFPVYAASHYSDGFPTTEGISPHTVAGTTIYSQADAPLIAVQDGRVVAITEAGPLGRSISLRDVYGNTYTYAELGTLATLYPVLEALDARHGPSAELSSAQPGVGRSSVPASNGATRMFRAGSENVYLHPLRVGAHLIAGTVLGHVGLGVQPHIVFQIRPAGTGAPAIDPKPILDGWVKLQSSAAVKAKGPDPFATVSPSPGQALLESKTQLEHQVRRDRGVHLASCVRHLIDDGVLDRRVLATLEFLSTSGLQPTVSAHSCERSTVPGPASAASERVSVDISAVNGVPVAASDGSSPTVLAAAVKRKLHKLQGVMKPLQIAGPRQVANIADSVRSASYAGMIHVAFTPLGGASAHIAGIFSPGLSPAQWIKLIARLGEVPDPTVDPKPSAAAIPDHTGTATPAATGGN